MYLNVVGRLREEILLPAKAHLEILFNFELSVMMTLSMLQPKKADSGIFWT
jgi:hypothetical protein